MIRRAGLAVTLLIPAACAPGEPTVDLAAETAALRAAADAYHAAAQALDASGVSVLYADDAVAYPPNEPTVEGRAGFEEYAAAFVSAPGMQMSFGTPEVVVGAGGDLGYTYAEVSASFQGPDGETVNETLRDVHLWRKDASGAWKVAVDIWNSPNPLPGME